ncbi:MAG: flippase-like domain-containing protein, partial [Deltaproteobacteria bacterium]|nr:flippase-like domain-containing protein [Deltaproteobacteria bacterium]
MSANPKRIAFFVLKLVFSVGMLAFIFQKVLRRDGAEDLLGRLSELHWGWVVAAVLMQLIAIGFSTVRWQRLLVGQGIFAKWRFLGGSIMIARFWGAFTPGGFTGTIGVEMILGQLAFGVVVMTASIFGMRFIGTDGVLLVNAVFLSIIVVGLAFLAQPQLFLFFTRFVPEGIRARVQTLIDAVGAYRGKAGLLIQAAALGVGTHAFNNLIYVCAARALGVELSIGEVFFASSLQILATLIPASINGIGLREAAAVALYTSPAVGLPLAVAVLIPTLGFACE